MQKNCWHHKPYYSLDSWCKNNLHRKCYKIALNAHMTCPNRDGSLDTRGCVFCSAGGSGDFAVDIEGKSIKEQLSEGLERLSRKFTLEDNPCLIAYFQAYTNTYAPLSYLRKVYTDALDSPQVCGISIATRPDCLPGDVILLLKQLKEAYPDKFIWVEIGLQTIHPGSAEFIRRGYPLSCFEHAFEELRKIDIPVIVHLILGLPGETKEMMLQSIAYLNTMKPFGVKLQLLHILKGTDLGLWYEHPEKGIKIAPLTKEQYLDILLDCIRHLDADIVIHRVTGDGPRKLLLAPTFSLNKKDVLNSLHKLFRLQNAVQGDRSDTTYSDSP